VGRIGLPDITDVATPPAAASRQFFAVSIPTMGLESTETDAQVVC
jgi:hypothetical protein